MSRKTWNDLMPVLRASNELLEMTGKSDDEMSDFDVQVKERLELIRKNVCMVMDDNSEA